MGSRSGIITEGHEHGNSPCDNKSPYYKNAELGGYILLIGVDQESNTTVHCCEELAGVPYHLQQDITEVYITGYNGEKILVRNRLHDWFKSPTDFNRFDKIYEDKGVMKKAVIGNSIIRLIDAGAMLEVSVGILEKDPLFLQTGME
jgi:aminoglycoside 3-N-acetyltransferase